MPPSSRRISASVSRASSTASSGTTASGSDTDSGPVRRRPAGHRHSKVRARSSLVAGSGFGLAPLLDPTPSIEDIPRSRRGTSFEGLHPPNASLQGDWGEGKGTARLSLGAGARQDPAPHRSGPPPPSPTCAQIESRLARTFDRARIPEDGRYRGLVVPCAERPMLQGSQVS